MRKRSESFYAKTGEEFDSVKLVILIKVSQGGASKRRKKVQGSIFP